MVHLDAMNARKSADSIIEVIHAKPADRAIVAHLLAPNRAADTVATRTRRIVDALNDKLDPTTALEARIRDLEAQLQRERANYNARYAETAAEGARAVQAARKEAATVIRLLTGLTDADLSTFTWDSTPDGDVAVKPVTLGDGTSGVFRLKATGTTWAVTLDDVWVAGGGAGSPASARDQAIGWIRYLHGFPVSFRPTPEL